MKRAGGAGSHLWQQQNKTEKGKKLPTLCGQLILVEDAKNSHGREVRRQQCAQQLHLSFIPWQESKAEQPIRNTVKQLFFFLQN